MRFDAIIFDFDGVLIESEYEGNVVLAEMLTEIGHPTTAREAVQHYTGLSGQDFIATLEARVGGALPANFYDRMREQRQQAFGAGIQPVAGAIEFVRSLPPELPKAVASSSSTRWVRTHLARLDLDHVFEPHIYSGAEHVANGKPAPDLYLYAAKELGVRIERTAIIEDSRVGAKGALAACAVVIGLAAGRHCFDGHVEMLRSVGVTQIAHDFDDVAHLIGLNQPSR